MRLVSNWDGHQYDPAGQLTAAPEPCPWCGEEDKPITARIYGEPAPHITTIVESSGIDVCGDCAPAVLMRALDEQDQRSRVLVRFEPIKQVV